MPQAILLAEILLLLAILNLILKERKEKAEPEAEGDLEAQVSAHVRQWADSIREGERIEKMFRSIP